MAEQRELNLILTVTDRISDTLKKVGTQTSKLGNMTSGLSIGVKSLVGAYLGVQGLKFALKTTIGAAIEWESAFAGVRKTVDGTEEELKGLSAGLLKMSRTIPVSSTELARLAEVAGQLGVGVDDIEDFTETVALLGVTTTLSSEEAAVNLARLSNIMQISIGDVDNLGSVLVELGNNFATTETEINDFSIRIAGAGQIAGLTAADILAIGAALSSVGVQAEAGGTAVQKVLIAINKSVVTSNKHLATFAQTAGMSAEEFRVAWKDNAGAAFTEFVEGLGKQGDQAITTLSALGLEDQRLIRSFLSLANAGDLLSDAMTTANDEFVTNTALTIEAEKRFKTTASQIQLLKNNFATLGRAIGTVLLPVINKTIEGFLIMAGMIEWVVNAVKNFVSGVNSGGITVGEFNNELEETANQLPKTTEETLSLADGITELSDEAKEAISNINKLREEVTAMADDNAKNAASTNKNIAETIVAQDEKVHDLKKEIRKLERGEDTDANATRLRELRKTLEEEEGALRTAANLRASLANEIEEAERRSALTAFERRIEDALHQRLVFLQNQVARLLEIQAEIGVEQLKNDAITTSYNTAQETIRSDTEATTELVIDEAAKQQKAWDSVFRSAERAINVSGTANSSVMFNIAGARADGGPVTAGRSYLVGERGPELFTPKSSGGITSNDRLGGGSGTTINVYGDVSGQELVEKVKDAISLGLKRQVRI